MYFMSRTYEIHSLTSAYLRQCFLYDIWYDHFDRIVVDKFFNSSSFPMTVTWLGLLQWDNKQIRKFFVEERIECINNNPLRFETITAPDTH